MDQVVRSINLEVSKTIEWPQLPQRPQTLRLRERHTTGMPRGCLPGRLSFWFSGWLLSHYTWRLELSGERVNTLASHSGPCEKIAVIFKLLEIEKTVRDAPIPGVSALHPIRRRRLPLPSTSAHRAIPATQRMQKEHSVRASYKSPIFRRPCRPGPIRNRSIAR